jgi:hypothetical protein
MRIITNLFVSELDENLILPAVIAPRLAKHAPTPQRNKGVIHEKAIRFPAVSRWRLWYSTNARTRNTTAASAYPATIFAPVIPVHTAFLHSPEY